MDSVCGAIGVPTTMASMNEKVLATNASKAFDVPDFAQMRRFLMPILAQEGDRSDVFETVDWFEHIAQHGFVDGVRPWLLGVRGQAAECCVLPLCRTGQGVRSLANYYSSLYGVAGRAPADDQAWNAVAQALRGDPDAAVIHLQPLAEDAAWAAALSRALRRHGYWVDRFQCFGNWFLPVVHSCFDDYYAGLPSALRHSIERGRRRLQRVGGHALTIHAQEGPRLAQEIEAFEAVYLQSWKQPEPCPQFMPGLMRLAAARGWLRLGVLRVQDRPVAAQLWLVKDGKANIYKLAYVQGFEKLSPGSVLTAAMMAYAMDVDRVREVDYLTGDDAYKRDWMTHRRERTGLVAFQRHRLRGIAAGARHFGGRALRRLQAVWRKQA